jgi:hypothetical protein
MKHFFSGDDWEADEENQDLPETSVRHERKIRKGNISSSSLSWWQHPSRLQVSVEFKFDPRQFAIFR